MILDGNGTLQDTDVNDENVKEIRNVTRIS